MRWVIIGAIVLCGAFVALMMLGGDNEPRLSNEQEAKRFQPNAATRLLGTITAPFAPKVALEPRRFAIAGGGHAEITIPPQDSDRLSLRLRLAEGRAAVAQFNCAVKRDEDLCGAQTCLSRDGIRPGGCGEGSPLDVDGSLVVLREGGTLELSAPGEAVTIEVP